MYVCLAIVCPKLVSLSFGILSPFFSRFALSLFPFLKYLANMQGKVNGFSFYSPMTDRRTQIAAHKNRRTHEGVEEAWQVGEGSVEATQLSPSELGLIRKYL